MQSDIRISVERSATHAPKRPTAPFQVALPSHVVLVSVRPMPPLPVAFDCKTPLHSVDNQIDPVSGNFDLGTDSESAFFNLQEYILFEATVKLLDRKILGGNGRVGVVVQKRVPQAALIEVLSVAVWKSQT